MGPPHRNVSTVSREVLANLGEVHNVEISRVTQQLLNGKFHDFLAVFALALSKIIQLAYFLDDDMRNYLNFLFKP